MSPSHIFFLLFTFLFTGGAAVGERGSGAAASYGRSGRRTEHRWAGCGRSGRRTSTEPRPTGHERFGCRRGRPATQEKGRVSSAAGAGRRRRSPASALLLLLLLWLLLRRRGGGGADIGARRWSSSREVSPSAGDVKMQRVRVLEDGHELGFSQHMPLDGVHQLVLGHLVAEVHLVVEGVELELDAVAAGGRDGAAPAGLLPVVDALLDAAVLAGGGALLAGEALGEALDGGRDVGDDPVRPRHDGAVRVRGVDVVHHQRQRPRPVGHPVPLHRRRDVLLRALPLQRVVPRQPPLVRRDRVRHQPQALLRHRGTNKLCSCLTNASCVRFALVASLG